MRLGAMNGRTNRAPRWIALASIIGLMMASVGTAEPPPVSAAPVAHERTSSEAPDCPDGPDCITPAGSHLTVVKVLGGALLTLGIGAVWIRERRLWQY
ncbi:MAG: hypothetical protein VCC04_13185 [Myxococcota bacterium]